jgi:hypothetical protein
MATNVVKDEEQSENFESAIPNEEAMKTLRRLDRAWKVITSTVGDGFMGKAKMHSLEEGEGMSIFRFLRPSRDSSQQTHNCEYYYAEKDSAPWVMMLNSYPRKEEFLRVYAKDSMYIICVSIPEHEAGDSTVQEIRVFRFLDNGEVEF